MPILLLTVLLVLSGSLLAQAPAVRAPAAGAAASTHAGLLPDRAARIDRLLQQYVDDGRIAGIAALVLRHGRPVYERAVGWADKEAGRPMTMDTLFRIASQTKAVTSVAVLMLVEEGRVALGDPVSRFIPAFARTTVATSADTGVATTPARRPITIRDLLTHTAGISYGTEPHVAALYEAKGLGPAAGLGWYTADKDEPICTTMARLAEVPFVAQPGERWVYGYSTDVLGCVVEQASGLPLDAFFRTRIFEPLGMSDTHFFLPSSKRDRLAAVYASGPDGRITRAPEGARGRGSYVDGPRRSFSGGAGLVSTIRDYARFLEMIRNDGAAGGVRLLAPRTVALMRTNQVGTLHSANGLGFGLGFQTTDRYGANGMDGVGAFGWAGAYNTQYRVDPDAGLVWLFMTQLLPNATDIREKFPVAVYQALE